MATICETTQFPNLVLAFSSVNHDKTDKHYFKSVAEMCVCILQQIAGKSDGCQIDVSFARSIDSVLQSSLSPSQNTEPQTVTHCITNCFRCLRNLCALCPANQDILSDSTCVIETTCLVVNHRLETGTKEEETMILMRCAVQFLGNLASGKRKNQLEIWQKLQNTFLQLMQLGDQKLGEYVTTVLHICLKDLAASLQPAATDHPSWLLLCAVIKYELECDSLNGLLVVEDGLKMQGFCENMFPQLDFSSRLLVLEVLISTLQMLQEEGEGQDDFAAVQNLQFLAADFIMQAHLIPKMTADQTEALCVVKELECLCLSTANHSKYGALQDNPSLLSAAVGLLRAIQELGRQGNSVFANVEKMSQLGDVDSDHPVFGLKRDLIRLLGNLAYKHKQNQDMVRELEGLPLILEQTNIDGKNPFITQWSVFALHNLTEENEENRLYIANLKLQGLANNQAVLDEMGMEAAQDGEKIVIKKRKT